MDQARRRHRTKTTAALAWDAFMVVLALGSVFLVLWFETAELTTNQRTTILRVDLLVVIVFLADWLVGLNRATNRRRYLKRTWWDLLGMVPLYVSAVGLLRFLRLLRIFRVLRAIDRVRRLLDRSRRIARSSQLAPLAIASATITVVGATLVWFVEQDAPQSGMTSYTEALWWAIVTVTTVGYGDITPVTAIGRGVAVVLMVTGIGTIGLLASQVSAALITQDEASAEAAAVADHLAKLASLHDRGKLTDAEFAAAKAKLLSQE